MASQKPNNPNKPSTSSNSMGEFPVRIKTEPGLSTARLASFRVPRDLTLGGANIKMEKTLKKKMFAPNTNIQRVRVKEEPVVTTNETENSRGKNRGRGRGNKNDRGRGRGGKQNNIIQTVGIFSQGITEPSLPGRRSGGYGGGSSDRESKSFLEKPKLNLNHVIDKAEEEEKLKLLLRDDFIDDGTDGDIDNAPISLPLINKAKSGSCDTKIKVKNSVNDDEETDQKPIILENGEAVASINMQNSKKPLLKENTLSPNVQEIIGNSSNSYMILRLPDILPGLRIDNEESDQSSSDNKPPSDKQKKNREEFCSLKNLKHGSLGKIQIHRSGKARLVLGENCFIIDVGSYVGFRQDVVAAKLDGEEKELVNLGPISNTLICTPDFESMLGKM